MRGWSAGVVSASVVEPGTTEAVLPTYGWAIWPEFGMRMGLLFRLVRTRRYARRIRGAQRELSVVAPGRLSIPQSGDGLSPGQVSRETSLGHTIIGTRFFGDTILSPVGDPGDMECWYALYTKPHREQHVRGLLEEKGMETFLPSIQVEGNGQSRTEPFFSCYLFARFDPAKAFPSLQWTPGLRRVLGFGGQLAVVPDHVVSAIRKRLAHVDARSGQAQPFSKGDRVTIKAGPLRDLEAVFDQSVSSHDRAWVLVDFLGRWSSCEVALRALERAK